MSSNSKRSDGYNKQIANIERITWDKESKEARAQARLRQAAENLSPGNQSRATTQEHSQIKSDKNDIEPQPTEEKQDFIPTITDVVGPSKSQRNRLKSRMHEVTVLDDNLGTRENVTESNSDDVSKAPSGVGRYRKVCDSVLTDSRTYLDHINSRNHQKYPGHTIWVEQNMSEQGQNRLTEMANMKEAEEESSTSSKILQHNCLEDTLQKKDEEALILKVERSKTRKEECENKWGNTEDEEEEKEEEMEEKCSGASLISPNIAVMMGFSGFASYFWKGELINK